MSRPTLYTPEIIEEICSRLAEGEPLEQICRDEGIPCSRTIRDWIEGKVDSVPKDISSAIARARDIGFDTIANNARQVARGKGESSGDVQRDKLIIDTDLKLLAKWNPRKYGDKMTLAGDAENPLYPVFKPVIHNANDDSNEAGA